MTSYIEDKILARLASLNFNDAKTDKLGRLKGDFAILVWQYVRFNDKYRADYDLLVKSRDQNPFKEEGLLNDFKDRWAISHLLEYEQPIPPESFYFKSNAVQFFKDWKRLSQWTSWHIPVGKNHPYLFAIIDLDKDPKIILQLLKSQLESSKGVSRFKASSSKSFGDNFICFYLRVVMDMKPKDAIEKYKAICQAPLQNAQLIKKVKSFRRLSAASPFIFFNAGN